MLSKFWYFFPILQHKNFQRIRESGGLSPSPRSGGTYPPVPPAPTPMASLLTCVHIKSSSYISDLLTYPDRFEIHHVNVYERYGA